MSPSTAVFHVELRQFPHATRAFNLSREELDARVLEPWASGRAIELDDRRWAPDRARLVIYEGRELATEEMGMGRGWANVTRSGEDVTEQLLAHARRALTEPPALAALKDALVTRIADGRVALSEVPAMATHLRPGARASERLALAEQAVWELLHEGRAVLVHGGEAIQRDQWQATILAWQAWTDAVDPAVSLRSA
jgi:hypothetical protein